MTSCVYSMSLQKARRQRATARENEGSDMAAGWPDSALNGRGGGGPTLGPWAQVTGGTRAIFLIRCV